MHLNILHLEILHFSFGWLLKEIKLYRKALSRALYIMFPSWIRKIFLEWKVSLKLHLLWILFNCLWFLITTAFLLQSVRIYQCLHVVRNSNIPSIFCLTAISDLAEVNLQKQAYFFLIQRLYDLILFFLQYWARDNNTDFLLQTSFDNIILQKNYKTSGKE